ncbi:hypothetical protein ACFR9U_13625 [Halorientalis brevis]|uniref:DUF8123 domain-containing protein n=1 Tax=Halorientalis brevis TaxID=1126241 RepID=A0ABD6CDB5_9EURY|nr:hypothetical protein [Halorientalis brevis]
MDLLGFTDKLEVLGLLVGAFLVLVGLGTLSGLPWETAASTMAGVTQVIGAIVVIGIGAALAWIARSGGNPA